MLKMIYCDKFEQKKVYFHKGLNTIVGDDIASNSIGKSNMLMIIDFVFGGKSYIEKNFDTVEQLGHHEFRFIFNFDNIDYYFIRKTSDYSNVYWCDNNFNSTIAKNIAVFTDWLKTKYACLLEDLSFRSIIGRYFRIYGKENLNEKKPIQYYEKEKAIESINMLLKLFNKHKYLKAAEKEINKLKEEKTTLTKAAKNNIIPNIVTKTLFNKNNAKITEFSNQLDELKKQIISSSIDIETLLSKEILDLKQKKSYLVRENNILRNKLLRTQANIKNKKININIELNQFVHYFPDFEVSQIEKIDGFHDQITSILKDELVSSEKETKNRIKTLESEIQRIDEEIGSKLVVTDTPTYAVDKVVELASQIKQLKEENGYYDKKKSLESSIKASKDNLDNLKVKLLDEICTLINTRMYELNKLIYPDGRRAPSLSIHNTNYSFSTNGDTGTGTAFANLIAFDLSLLELTCLPALAHDLPLLKNIENTALENIISLYSKSSKQIFIAIDKLSSYNKSSTDIIEKYKVLQLSKDKLLFIKNWKNEKDI